MMVIVLADKTIRAQNDQKFRLGEEGNEWREAGMLQEGDTIHYGGKAQKILRIEMEA